MPNVLEIGINIGEEVISIKPSADLIADEYDNENKTSSVHIFASLDYKDAACGFMEFLSDLKFPVTEENNVHPLDSTIYGKLDEICDNAEDKSCLIMLFMGLCNDKDSIIILEDGSTIEFKTVWSRFTSSNCPKLKNKPKVFIFNMHQRKPPRRQSFRTFTDGAQPPDAIEVSKYFEMPSEADLFIMIHQNEIIQESLKFLDSLCDVIKQYGNYENIFELMAQTEIETMNNVPLTISTMSKNMYLIPNVLRKYHHTISENSIEIQQLVDEINKVLAEKNLVKRAPKSLLGKIGKTGPNSLPTSSRTSRKPSISFKTCTDGAATPKKGAQNQIVNPRWKY